MAVALNTENEGVFYPLLFTRANILSDPRYRGEDTAIVVSSTATGARSYGLLNNLEQTFPYAIFHPGRTCDIPDHFLTTSTESYKTPGGVVVHRPVDGVDEPGPTVIEIVTRVVPGNAWPHNAYSRSTVIKGALDKDTLELIKKDTDQARSGWFMEALKNLENTILHGIHSKVKNVYFPAGTGSSMNDPFWLKECIPMLSALSRRLQPYGVRVSIVTRPGYEKNPSGRANHFTAMNATGNAPGTEDDVRTPWEQQRPTPMETN